MDDWHFKFFDELTNIELYELLKLRQEIFVVEQTCPYLDADGKDFYSYHVLGYDENKKLVACARIIPPGKLYDEPSIGRVTTAAAYRRTGLGRELFKKALIFTDQKFGHQPVKIMAQSYLRKFYESFDFVVCSEEFLEDNIPHLMMKRG